MQISLSNCPPGWKFIGSGEPDPTQAEIKERAAAIRAGWSETDRRRRLYPYGPGEKRELTVEECGVDDIAAAIASNELSREWE